MDYSNNMTVSEQQLATWAKPPSDSEKQRCVNAVALIKDAIHSDLILSTVKGNIKTFGQGSYQNHTNVRLDSDVDVCVLFKGLFLFDIPVGRTPGEFGISPGPDYPFSAYKNSVEAALRRKFRGNTVERGNKSIKLKSNTNRVEADVVPAFEYRNYTGSGYEYYDGIKFHTDGGEWVVNYPRQHGDSGNAKNSQTSRRYKRIVRLLKKINYELAEDGYIPSFLVECLAWNVPDTVYSQRFDFKYADILLEVLQYIHLHTKPKAYFSSKGWREVNGLIPLFGGHSKWTKRDAANFAVRASNFVNPS